MAAGLPRIDGKSHNTCSIDGNVQLYLQGKFPADAQVVFDDLAGWRANGQETCRIDGGDIQVLVCKVPPYEGQRSTRPKQVKLKVQGARQDSQQHNFTYTPKDLRYEFTMTVEKYQLTKQEFKQGLESLVLAFGHGVPSRRVHDMVDEVENLAQKVIFRVNDDKQAIDKRNSRAVEEYNDRGFFAEAPLDSKNRVASPQKVADDSKEQYDVVRYTNASYHTYQSQAYDALEISAEVDGLTDSHVELCNLLDRQTEVMSFSGANHITSIEEALESVLCVVMLRFKADCTYPNNLCKKTGDGYAGWESHARVLMSFAAIWLLLEVLRKEKNLEE